MRGKHHPTETEFVEPDLPITPMLDMSFQLMAFFIFTFRPAPTEGQIAMSLPKQEGGESTSIPDPSEVAPEVFIVKVDAATNGTITKMTMTQKDAVDARPVDLGANLKALQAELTERYKAAKNKPKAKVMLEIDDKLIQEYVVQLVDHASRAGFTNIAPTPLNKR
jgi:biopolymer transport protein ExbD